VKRFIAQHADHITGTISCFDRLLFKGYLPLGWSDAMEKFIARQGLRIKDFKRFVLKQSARIKEHAQALAAQAQRPWIHLHGQVRKEDLVGSILQRDGITEGLVAILTAVEGCQSFKVVPGVGRPRVVPARRKCLAIYFYFLDRELGLLHVRLQTWFPFTIQICLNGHDWLARKLDRHDLAYRKLDNAFLWIEDPSRAQRFADRFVARNWPRILSALARRVNPLMQDLLRDKSYYWVVDQAEYATDVLFRDRAALHGLYDALLKHAIECFRAEDVMTFLGRKLRPNFAGEVLSDFTRRWPGARVRHRVKQNALKMYDKHGSVLRVETVINQPGEFRVRRRRRRRGQLVTDWFPLTKGVAYLYRLAEIGRAANRRYLDALAVVHDPTPIQERLTAVARPVRQDGRSYRGFNPADEQDLRLFAAVLAGRNLLSGFRNRDLRDQLGPDASAARTTSAHVTRLLKRLHVHGFIAKIPHSHRWRLTAHGQSVLTIILRLYQSPPPTIFTELAA
jgi:hypothetical protein